MNRSIIAMAAAGVLLAALTLTVSAEADEAGTGCTQTGGYTMCATDPNGAKDTAIVSEIVRQVDATGAGDTIRAAVYQWTLDAPVAPLADAMIAARKRGVDVRAVLGTRSDRPAANDPAIGKLKAAGVTVRQCSGSCLPNALGTRKGPMHNRFFLIEQGGAPTVLVTSFNFTWSQTTQAHNLLGVHGDRGLFDFYTSYWNRLYAGNWDGWTDKNKSTTAASRGRGCSRAATTPSPTSSRRSPRAPRATGCWWRTRTSSRTARPCGPSSTGSRAWAAPCGWSCSTPRPRVRAGSRRSSARAT